MRKLWLIAAMVALWSSLILPASADDLSGSWFGPWYRGMTSGTMTLHIDSNGGGMIQMTNLDGFPEDEVVLSKVKKGDRRFKFSASGEGAGVFAASTQLSGDGEVLEGKGEYDGFPIEFRLKRR
ncbi:MAG: hypothetical protein JSU95_08225 [Betaproteobacteria bacterium]|nr:MAG: hypothetical protein JSU95_08225 [Betaproteobacteria bacterium]